MANDGSIKTNLNITLYQAISKIKTFILGEVNPYAITPDLFVLPSR